MNASPSAILIKNLYNELKNELEYDEEIIKNMTLFELCSNAVYFKDTLWDNVYDKEVPTPWEERIQKDFEKIYIAYGCIF